MLSLGERGQVSVEGSRDDAFVAEVDLDLTEVLALLKEMGGVGMAQSVRMSGLLDAARTQSETEGALDGGTRLGRVEVALARRMGCGEDQEGVTVGFPVKA